MIDRRPFALKTTAEKKSIVCATNDVPRSESDSLLTSHRNDPLGGVTFAAYYYAFTLSHYEMTQMCVFFFILGSCIFVLGRVAYNPPPKTHYNNIYLACLGVL